MLRPPADCRNQLRVSIEDTSIITPKPSEDYTSRSAVASPTSLSSKAPSFIRPISSFLTKSSEAVTELNWHLKTNGDYYPPTSSTTQSRESSILSSSSRHPDSSMWKSPSWTKVFNGYVSPRNTSRLFQPLKRKKSKATSLNEDYVYTRRRRKTVTQQETVAQREARAYSTPRVPRQGSLSRDQGATSCSPEEKILIDLSPEGGSPTWSSLMRLYGLLSAALYFSVFYPVGADTEIISFASQRVESAVIPKEWTRLTASNSSQILKIVPSSTVNIQDYYAEERPDGLCDIECIGPSHCLVLL
ncbi:hypothetical protein PIIN_04091 [Serendipita indica DSM 11827]|uniref:Uncharacterized protein n=1 Tax=Serendipita indica (strain DSM 11827) TaxID=1109443 RepID=G4TFP8_SERID|nr:hypothetical protein PIIN_04091 [Serendipita indica DSM 11827]